ncbi:LysM peptidoglycan-binding domain-containing protein [Hymenobacter sp. HSC-4F20]|uniref:LysM peptidoglycan-binding domain-containing protein n=1 Tax=Hymenobacter sp. HSC-4F20 TaxID=2864135 RepID=UPI001C72C9DE|nr:LysM domain-containing protein [Hymenobacter sp. HSC-4F20]MBX0290914.1 LysM peptidoglycan-binding domain-containing protein [Hymenobacter sp. HSC-4F20]
MRLFSRTLVLMAGLSCSFFAAHAQQAEPAPTLSEDSVRVMSGLVQSSVRKLRAIYFEPNDLRAVALIDAALVEIPVLNQRLSHYTASLPREQQQQLAQRLRQQPWQVELNTLLRSPQFKGFDARAAKNPALKTAADRLHASGFVGTKAPTTPAVPAVTQPNPAVKPSATVASATPGLTPAAKQPTANAPKATTRHTVQKGETLFSISKQYHVTPAQLQEWNSKPDGSVKIGEVLVVESSR